MIDFRDYLEYAEKYLDEAKEKESAIKNLDKFLIPATILAWAAIESLVNNMLDDFSSLHKDTFELHERAFLLEKKIRFVDNGNNIGIFELEGTDYRKIDDKIFFLISKFGKNLTIKKGTGLWQRFSEFKEVRDNLVHPRRTKEVKLSINNVMNYINTAKELIKLISKNVWGSEVKF